MPIKVFVLFDEKMYTPVIVHPEGWTTYGKAVKDPEDAKLDATKMALKLLQLRVQLNDVRIV